MPEFRTLAKVHELPEGTAKAVPVGAKTIALFHHDGVIHALDDVCPHMGASLATGRVAEGVVTCPWHAWRFRLCDGVWMNSPKVKTGSYPVRVVGEEIQVEV